MIFTTLSRSGGVHPSFSSSSHDDSAALSQQQTKSRSLLFGQFLSSVHLLLSRFTASAFRGRIVGKNVMKSKKWDNNTTKTASTRVLFISTGRNSVLLTCVSNVSQIVKPLWALFKTLRNMT